MDIEHKRIYMYASVFRYAWLQHVISTLIICIFFSLKFTHTREHMHKRKHSWFTVIKKVNASEWTGDSVDEKEVIIIKLKYWEKKTLNSHKKHTVNVSYRIVCHRMEITLLSCCHHDRILWLTYKIPPQASTKMLHQNHSLFMSNLNWI